jgi:hypothetical protein
VPSIHGVELALAVEAVDKCTTKIYKIIQSIRDCYNTKKQLKKLRTSFCQRLQVGGSVSKRKIANNWRCIQYAIENQIPREFFVLTNYKRMVEKMKGTHAETEESESVSSTFEEILESPLPLEIQESNFQLQYPVDIQCSENLDNSLEESASAPNPTSVMR